MALRRVPLSRNISSVATSHFLVSTAMPRVTVGGSIDSHVYHALVTEASGLHSLLSAQLSQLAVVELCLYWLNASATASDRPSRPLSIRGTAAFML